MKPDPAEIKKILIIQFRPFGDVLLATSYLKALKEAFPWAHISYLVKKPFDEVLYKNPYLSEIITIYEKKGVSYIGERLKLMGAVRNRNFDLVINQQNGSGSGQVVLTSGAKYRLGWEDGKWGMAHNLKAKKESIRYRAALNFDMLKPLGIEDGSVDLFYHVKNGSESYIEDWLVDQKMNNKSIICISPGSPRKEKRWHIPSYARVADLIHSETEFVPVILWSPNELNDAEAMLSLCKQKPVLAPDTNFNQAAALLKKSMLLICNDGGLNHLSVATKTPSLAIFGNTNPDHWSPQGLVQNHYHLYNKAFDSKSDDSFGIYPDETFKRVKEILNDLSTKNEKSGD